MTPHASQTPHASELSSAPPQSFFTTSVALYRHGMVAGLLGAATLALWFLWLDWGRGRPLFTPTLLGTMLFEGGRALGPIDQLQGSVPMTIAFSVVHGLVFMLMGVVAAPLVAAIERGRGLVLAIVLTLVVLQLGFLAFRMTFAAVALDALQWPEVVFGNLLAAAVMINYLWRRRPRSQPVP